MDSKPKPYVCDCCNHSFRDSYGLKRHLSAKYLHARVGVDSITKNLTGDLNTSKTHPATVDPETSQENLENANANSAKKDYGLRKQRKATFKKSAALRLKHKTQLKVKLKFNKSAKSAKSITNNSKEKLILTDEHSTTDENSTASKKNDLKMNNKKTFNERILASKGTSKLSKSHEGQIPSPIQIRRRQLKKRYLRFLNSIDYNDLLDVAEEYLTNMKIIAANKCFKAIRVKNVQKVE